MYVCACVCAYAYYVRVRDCVCVCVCVFVFVCAVNELPSAARPLHKPPKMSLRDQLVEMVRVVIRYGGMPAWSRDSDACSVVAVGLARPMV